VEAEGRAQVTQAAGQARPVSRPAATGRTRHRRQVSNASCNGTCNGCNALQLAVPNRSGALSIPLRKGCPQRRHHVSTASGPLRFVHGSCSSSGHCWRCSEVASEPGTHLAGTQPSTHEISTLDDSQARWPPHHTDCVLPALIPAPAGRRSVRAGPAGLLQTLPKPFPNPFDTLYGSLSGNLARSLRSPLQAPSMGLACRRGRAPIRRGNPAGSYPHATGMRPGTKLSPIEQMRDGVSDAKTCIKVDAKYICWRRAAKHRKCSRNTIHAVTFFTWSRHLLLLLLLRLAHLWHRAWTVEFFDTGLLRFSEVKSSVHR
jgi:hypothetical protein